MSYDLRVWGRTLTDISTQLPAGEGWEVRGDAIVRAERSWQIVIRTPQAVEPEDVPEEVTALLPGLSSLVDISLEPILAPKAARSVAKAAAKAIAEELAGVVEDPQEGTLKLPRGAQRYLKAPRHETLSVLDVSWWYLESPLRSTTGPAELLRTLRRHVPEAVPRRYGLWEPPPYKTAEVGLDALATFLAANLGHILVLYGTRPVVDIGVLDCNGTPHPRLGFRANLFNLKFEADVLEQPGWERAIRSLWRDVSRFLRPFYGEARVLSGFVWGGATVGYGRKTEEHPVQLWFWRGVPSQPRLAMVLGPPYTSLWRPENAAERDGLLFVEPERWSKSDRLRLDVPHHLAQRRTLTRADSDEWCRALPETFPF